MVMWLKVYLQPAQDLCGILTKYWNAHALVLVVLTNTVESIRRMNLHE